MRKLTYNKVKRFLLGGLAVLSMAFGALLYTAIANPVEAKADALASTEFKTDGASVRVFKKSLEGEYKETDRQGIRLHVQTGADYEVAEGIKLLDTTQKNSNGSYKMAEGYKSYTLIIPTRLMGGSSDLTMELEKVAKVDTTNHWFVDNDGNWESVAAIYNIPDNLYTDEYTYRGIIVSVDAEGKETPVKWTNMETRILSAVAKQAYNDTIDNKTNYWGTADKDNAAAPLIKAFIPTYTINYSDGTTGEAFWGDMLENVGGSKTYYNETNLEPVDVTLPLNMPTNCTITSTQASTFVFTGVEYTENGFNVYATLPTGKFAADTKLKPSTVDMVTGEGNKITAKSVSVLVEGEGDGAVSKLAIGFDYTDISNGTTLTMLKSSHFYNDGILYELETDYEFTYNNNKWELPLGYISLGDIAQVENYEENGEHNIRITFSKDVLVNGEVTLEGTVKIVRDADGSEDTINRGYYYWNQGQHMILELFGDTTGGTSDHNLWGEENEDKLIITAGTKLVQRNGYYIFQDDTELIFDGTKFWAPSLTIEEIDASAFTEAYTRQDNGRIYIDVYTSKQWQSKLTKVVLNEGTLTYHNTDNVTSINPNEIFYHGENDNRILRIYLDTFSVTGDWVTIPKNTEFWVGNHVYRLTEDVISYFVSTDADFSDGNNGMTWVTNPTIEKVGLSNILNMHWASGNVRYTTDVAWSTAANNKVVLDDTFIEGDGLVVSGSNYSNFFYYGGGHKFLELQGTNFSAAGGSVVLKAGVILWLFDNTNTSKCTGAYLIEDDLVIEISGAAGSAMYKDIQQFEVTKDKIVNIYNDGSHAGELRFELNGTYITGMYGAATVEGSATLSGTATTSAFVYGGDGTSGYTGNTIVAFTGQSIGKAFQASAKGEKVSIAAGTKLWLSNGSGYVTIAETLNYVYNGSGYVDADTQYTVTFTGDNATVKVNDEAVTSVTANAGDNVEFTVEVPTGYRIASVKNATCMSDQTYITDRLFDNVTVEIVCAKPIEISQEDVKTIYIESANEFRIGLNKDRAEISAITGGNYNIAFNGTTEFTLGGVEAQPTQYNYFGQIGEANHQLLELKFDTTKFVSGDSVTIKAGSTFTFGNTVLLVKGDIVAKVLGITANFNSDLATLSVNGTGLENGVPVAKIVGSGTSTVVFGWKNDANGELYNKAYDLTSVKINSVEQGVSGTYDIELNGDVTIDVTTTPKTYTATVTTTNASVSGISNNETITHGQTYNFTVSANNGYTLTSVTINGAEQGTGGSYSFTASGATSIVVTAKKLYTVTANTSGGVSVDAATKTVVEGDSVTFNLTVPTDAKIKANGGDPITGTSYTVSNVTANTTITFTTWYQVTVTTNGATVSGVTTGLYESGSVIKPTVSYEYDSSRSFTINGTKHTSGAAYTIVGKTEISASSEWNICIVEGTMILMADGTQKAVEDLVYGDKLLAFNHLTGNLESVDMAVLGHEGMEAQLGTVISAGFSDGTVLKIFNSHGLYDMTLKQYVFLTEENASEYIGHEFYAVNYINGNYVEKTIVLTNISITQEVVRAFSPSSMEYMNCFAEGLLNVTATLFNRGEFVNMFLFNDDLTYNKEEMMADIEKYGLYTYEDFEAYMPYEMFEKLPFDVLKVSVGKGLITWEEILVMIDDLHNQPGVIS